MARKLKPEELKVGGTETAKSAGEAAHLAQEAQDASDAANELAMLHPDLSIRLRDRLLTLREYRGLEGLHLQSTIRPLLADMYALFDKSGAPPSALQVREVFAKHSLSVQWLVAQSFTPYPETPLGLEAFTENVATNAAFVATLDDLELDALLATWWGATSGFFIRRFREQRLAENPLASSGSTEP